jgi:hypothetical protein
LSCIITGFFLGVFRNILFLQKESIIFH